MNKKEQQIQSTIQSLRDEVRILAHPPGSIRRDIEIELIADRKRDEAAARAKKASKQSKKEDEKLALHLLKTSHGTVRALDDLLQEHVREASSARLRLLRATPVADAVIGRRRSGRPDWAQAGHSEAEVRRVRGGRRGGREVYLGSSASLRLERD